MYNPRFIGDISEACIAAALMRKGLNVALPMNKNLSYDLIIEYEGVFKKVQCKTGRLVKESIWFSTSKSKHKEGKWIKEYYENTDTDFFAVYVPQINRSYLIPVELLTLTKRGNHLVAKRSIKHPKSLLAEDFRIKVNRDLKEQLHWKTI